jgi:tRNA1(Val) A37 N6-methylase TrmN6
MTTVDKFLDGRILLTQPAKGYRAGIDAVLLAAAVHPSAGSQVLDVGAGVGAVMLCLSHHHPDVFITGLELQTDMVKLNRQNILLNSKSGKVKIIQGNILEAPVETQPNSFDHVLSNPPYFAYGSEASSDDKPKALSRHLADIDLKLWVNACLRMVKPRGHLTLIYRADRLDEIMSILKIKAGGIKIFPLWPTRDTPAKLVLVQARKGVKTACELLPGLLLHQNNKEYTPEAEAVFRGDAILKL